MPWATTKILPIIKENPMKIERVIWANISGGECGVNQRAFDYWFDECVEPINKMLSEGVEVYGTSNLTYSNYDSRLNFNRTDHHSALLINRQPIKRKSREQQLEEFVVDLSDVTDAYYKYSSKELLDE